MQQMLSIFPWTAIPAVATQDKAVFETLKEIKRRVNSHVHREAALVKVKK